MLLGAAGVAAVLVGIIEPSEKIPCAQIYWLYRAALGRAPTENEVRHWHNARPIGTKPEQIVKHIMASDEIQSKFGANATDQSAILRLYRNGLDRAPDDLGYSFWLNRLKKSQDRVRLTLDFAKTLEEVADWKYECP